MHEAWLLIERALLKTKTGRDFALSLDAEAGAGFDRLKKRFGVSNPLAAIRNNFAFHHPTVEQMEAAYQLAAKADSRRNRLEHFF